MKKFKVKVEIEVEVEAQNIEEAHAAVFSMRASFDYGYGTINGKTGYQTSNGIFLKLMSKKVKTEDTEVVS